VTTTGLRVRHNIEVAHRLSLLAGKCEAIHGHSMWVDLAIEGNVNPRTGILADLDFGLVKKAFRTHLDTEYDHHLLLNSQDEFVSGMAMWGLKIPGLRECPGDPTTENIARWIGEWSLHEWGSMPGVTGFNVIVNETSVNAATWSSQ
jgi:6-pyruvoyl-tetrahydropterin synthase